jgi:murein DD-endopeptidase MepM/ murein hydrolase activator NlpD
MNLVFGENPVFWVGRVVDNGDPLGLGRCRVRIAYWHSQNTDELPNEALPWAYPITPITNPGIAGIGISATGPQINSRIFGLFLDGKKAQQPIMLGTIPGETIKCTTNKISYGSTAQQPIIDKLFGFSPFERESDCPDGYDIDTTSTNEEIPDPRDIKINPSEWSLPATGFVSSAYAERSGKHRGVDISTAGIYKQNEAGASHLNGRLRGPTGYPVRAAADGIVKYIWTNDKGQKGAKTTYDIDGNGSRSYGNAVAIQHTLSTGTFTTIYAHLGTNQDAQNDMAGDGINVSVGQTVSKGQQIGTIGRTHNRDTLTHLHFEVRVGGGLPKAENHINPGRIFPQLLHRHQPYIAWANSQMTYNAKPLFSVSKAPIKETEGPIV